MHTYASWCVAAGIPPLQQSRFMGHTCGEETPDHAARVARIYDRRGYTPEQVAVNILRAVARDRAVAPITPEAHLLYALTRVAPPVARWLAARTSAVLAR